MTLDGAEIRPFVSSYFREHAHVGAQDVSVRVQTWTTGTSTRMHAHKRAERGGVAAGASA